MIVRLLLHPTRSLWRGTTAGLVLALLLALGASKGEAQEPVDLELILAVDTSLSVDEKEFALQMQGLAYAFAHPAVANAIRAAGDLGISVTLMQWSDRHQQHVSLPWTRVRDAASAQRVAQQIAGIPRAFGGAGTAIGGAIAAALPLFETSGTTAPRRIIDVSGDGIDNRGPFTRRFWADAAKAGVTINGLAILNEDPKLDLYYQRSVIYGTGAFVITAVDYDDFARAISGQAGPRNYPPHRSPACRRARRRSADANASG